MEMHQLRYFVAVAEELHFGRAARRENVSQPPLSLQIKKLEEELDVLLLERTRRRVALTEAGAAFLIEARKILATCEQARHVARSANRGEIGEVTIGFVHSASIGYLPNLLGPFRKSLPDVIVNLREMTVSEQLLALRKGEIDVGIVRPPIEETGIASFTVLDEAFYLVIPSSHAFAARKSVAIDELADQDFVFYPKHRSPAFYRQLTKLCFNAGFMPKIAVEANTIYTAIGLVGAGAGVAIIPESVICVQSASVRYLLLEGHSERARLSMAYIPSNLSRCAAQLVEFEQSSGPGSPTRST